MTKRSYRSLGCEIMAVLMRGPLTWQEVTAKVGLSEESSVGWLHSMRDSGIVRISGYMQTSDTPRMSRVFSLQTTPFALPDVPYPHRKRREVKRELRVRVPCSIFDLASMVQA